MARSPINRLKDLEVLRGIMGKLSVAMIDRVPELLPLVSIVTVRSFFFVLVIVWTNPQDLCLCAQLEDFVAKLCGSW